MPAAFLLRLHQHRRRLSDSLNLDPSISRIFGRVAFSDRPRNPNSAIDANETPAANRLAIRFRVGRLVHRPALSLGVSCHRVYCTDLPYTKQVQLDKFILPPTITLSNQGNSEQWRPMLINQSTMAAEPKQPKHPKIGRPLTGRVPKVPITFRVPPALRAALANMAVSTRRLPSTEVEIALEEYLSKHGFWPPKDKAGR